MEDILASIKRIIADDSNAASDIARARGIERPARAPDGPPPAPEQVLELTEPAAPMHSAPASPLVSEVAAAASRQALAALGTVTVKPVPGQENTLEGLVRELLRPMLKEWLDARLPDLVEGVVAREIARITGDRL